MTVTPVDCRSDKAALRAFMLARRRQCSGALGPDAGALIAAQFAAAGLWPASGPGTRGTVAGYVAIGSEADPLPLLQALHQSGASLALPAVVAPGQPLLFRRWAPGEDLADGPFGTRQPHSRAATVTPALLLVPLLAFDRRGGRLGYGAGYYDRTLERLRQEGAAVAVGIAFAAQECRSVPQQQTDQRLDFIVTEQGVVEVSA